VTLSIAYQRLWPELLNDPQEVMGLCQKLNILQTSDSITIESLAKDVLNENPDQLDQYKKGKKGIITFFMGQLMRKSRGTANPEIARKTLEKILSES
jgi:aspartyl-tRNA(Asn)/glutamyl-tRNA(Gln) amidotransferase subunit B